MKMNRKWLGLAFSLALVAGNQSSLMAEDFFINRVEKVVDLGAGNDAYGNIQGLYNPESRFTLVGTNLYFTTVGGGVNGNGTLSKLTLVTHELSVVASLENSLGKAPNSPLLAVDDSTGYFTTTSAGVGGKGTIVKADLTTGQLTAIASFGTTNGATPRTGLTQIGDDLYTMTSLGGTSSKGVIAKYNLTRNTLSVVTNFDGPQIGGYPYANPILVNGAYYFTTLIGGNSTGLSGTPLGAGTLERFSFDGDGNIVVAKLADLQPGTTQFAGGTPVLVGTNSLYFSTTGPNSAPGSILRYNLDSGTLTDLFDFKTNSALALANGTRPGYGGLVNWQDELYFLTAAGGSSNLGVVAKFNIASNTVVKLADLDGQTGPLALGKETGGFNNDGLVVQETNRFFIYFTVYSGGSSGLGTILRVYLPPQPIQASAAKSTDNTLTVSWTGGYPPFDVVTNSDLSVPVTSWPVAIANVNSDVNQTNWSTTLPVPAGNTFFRIRGQSQ